MSTFTIIYRYTYPPGVALFQNAYPSDWQYIMNLCSDGGAVSSENIQNLPDGSTALTGTQDWPSRLAYNNTQILIRNSSSFAVKERYLADNNVNFTWEYVE